MTDARDALQSEESAASDAIAPEDAFASLAGEKRIEILRALAEAHGEPIGFNELRERVGAKDSSGFNYHLRKLVGRFVRKTEAGYELTTAGAEVYGAIISGTYTDTVDLAPIELSHPEDVCPHCDGPLVATYEDEKMQVTCADCERTMARSSMPPAAVEGRPTEAIPEAYGQYLRASLERTKAGFCAVCSGRMTSRLTIGEKAHLDVDEDTPVVIYDCERCFDEVHATPGAVLLSHPAVVSFFHERGLDVRQVPLWRLPSLGPDATTVVEEDPLRVSVDIEYEGDVLTVTLDENVDVVDTELTAGSS